jgi:hypothetical protein
MLKNLTPRERFLALLVLGLAPLLLLFWAFTSFTSRYFSNRTQLNGLRLQVDEQLDLQSDAELAQQRRFWYRNNCLPADSNLGPIAYEAWLTNLLEKETGLKLTSLTPEAAQGIRYRQGSKITDVGFENTWKFVGEGNLEQLLKAIRGFQALPMMHRISGLVVRPKTVGGSGREAVSRTGLLRIEMEIQALALVDAEVSRDLAAISATPSPDLQTAMDEVLKRNIFGPANNAPRITSSASKTAETEETVVFDITAEDTEDEAGLRFELVGDGIAGAALKPTDSPSRVMFECPPLAAETYRFTVRVTDSGFPPKSTEKEFSLRVREKEVVQAEPEPPKPEFRHAKATKLTALTAVGGRSECWVEVQTLGERHRLEVGESFELDDQTWTVREISFDEDSVTFECGQELRRIRRGKTLDQPHATEALASKAPATDGSN